jgi:predicted DsbA family dithiol-disulfide isomerase
MGWREWLRAAGQGKPMTETLEHERQSVTEVFRAQSRQRRAKYEEARDALLRLIRETENSAEPVDVIAEVADETGIGEPDVQNALFGMHAAREVRYEDDRYLVNDDH